MLGLNWGQSRLNSNVTHDSVATVRAGVSYVSNTQYDYRLKSSDGTYDGGYAGGVLTHSRTTNTVNGAAAATSDTVNTYQWWDGAKIATTEPLPKGRPRNSAKDKRQLNLL